MTELQLMLRMQVSFTDLFTGFRPTTLRSDNQYINKILQQIKFETTMLSVFSTLQIYFSFFSESRKQQTA